MSHIAIVSAGSYGTALACVLAKNGHQVRLHVPEDQPATYEQICAGENADYLEGIRLDGDDIADRIHPTHDFSDAARGAEFVLLTVPAQGLKDALNAVAQDLEPNGILVLASKGMVVDREGGVETVSDIARKALPGTATVCGLYGVTFARFIALGQGLSSMCVAAPAPHEDAAMRVAELFTRQTPENFRIYVSNDLRGAEFGGAMKNVYALTMGLLDEYFALQEDQLNQSREEFGPRTSRHSLLNLCIMEFIQFGLRHGASIHTLLGPSGIGDIGACANDMSRNYKYGRYHVRLQEKKPEKAPRSLNEGYFTLKAAMRLAEGYGLHLPMLEATYDMLFERTQKVREVIPRLLRGVAETVYVSEVDDAEIVFPVERVVDGRRRVTPAVWNGHCASLVHFIRPQDLHLRSDLDAVRRALGRGFPDIVSEGEHALLCKTVYDVIRGHNWLYDFEPGLGDYSRQMIRPPREMYADRVGTCLDFACLFAALVECMQADPVIVRLQRPGGGHALAGCWIRNGQAKPCIQDQYLVQESLRRGNLLLFETTGAARARQSVAGEERPDSEVLDFEAAQDAARSLILGFSWKIDFLLDVLAARSM
jgi:glycerol-3-phosphate dehydrogenase (NAD(P)+)